MHVGSVRGKHARHLLGIMLTSGCLFVSAVISPAVEAQTAPPPDHVTSDYSPGPWTIFFDRNSSKIDPGLFTYLDQILDTDFIIGPISLLIKGHASREEKVDVGARRAAAVRDYLTARGLRRSDIKVIDAETSEPRGRPGGKIEEDQRVVINRLTADDDR
jgi:hypothetical protein